jgi:hypothetical protein
VHRALRAFELEERELDPDDPWNEFLQDFAFGIRSTCHTTLQASPGQLVPTEDIFLVILQFDLVERAIARVVGMATDATIIPAPYDYHYWHRCFTFFGGYS